MWVIRIVEERCEKLFREAKVRGAMHLYSGQEAVAVGTCNALSGQDRLLFTYRSHGWALARGMRVEALLGELLGREEGCCKGRAGSKNLCDWSMGIFPSSAIVGANLPIANGVALAARRLDEDRVVVTAFGEGATNQGVVHEALAQATIWNLPVVFVCENNLYAELTPASEFRPTAEVVDIAAAAAMPTLVADGMDVEAVEETAKVAVDRARSGGGPTFIEYKTYRFCGHMTGDPQSYRTADEVDQWRQRDPLEILAARLTDDGVGADELDEIRARAHEAVRSAEAAALEMSPPSVDDILAYAPSWMERTR
ncbi:MAG TPA: thiamine pyrophosphate-dependent dehydrogenase E1 component subunit alpha [Pseudonocardia sp.]